jgi:hypothetical protein
MCMCVFGHNYVFTRAHCKTSFRVFPWCRIKYLCALCFVCCFFFFFSLQKENRELQAKVQALTEQVNVSVWELCKKIFFSFAVHHNVCFFFLLCRLSFFLTQRNATIKLTSFFSLSYMDSTRRQLQRQCHTAKAKTVTRVPSLSRSLSICLSVCVLFIVYFNFFLSLCLFVQMNRLPLENENYLLCIPMFHHCVVSN